MAQDGSLLPRRRRSVRSAAARAVRHAQPRHPAQIVTVAFLIGVGIATVLLLLPIAHAEGDGTTFREALFTATSAVCVTGLAVVDTGTHWSIFGQAVILAGMQIGGFGIMTLASLLGLFVSRRLGLRNRLLAQAETPTQALGDVRRVVRGVLVISLVVESITAVALTLRFWLAYDEPLGRATWRGVFHSVSSFNHGGFALEADSLVGYVSDPWVCLPVAGAVIVGSVGFPVLFDLRGRLWHARRWSLHTKITVWTTVGLLIIGPAVVTAFEWTNEATIGRLSWAEKMMAGFFHGVQTRSSGFNTVDIGEMREITWLVTDGLMFIGGGSASTAGGIKVTTFMVLLFAIIAEARGDAAVDVFHRAIPIASIRLAISVALVGVAVVFCSTLLMLALTGLSLDRVLFECISAFGTVGLSTGITPDLPPSAQYLLVVLMFVGRVGTVTTASALALRERRRLYAYPEERPIVG